MGGNVTLLCMADIAAERLFNASFALKHESDLDPSNKDEVDVVMVHADAPRGVHVVTNRVSIRAEAKRIDDEEKGCVF